MALRGPAAKAVKHGRTATADWTDVPDTPFPGPSPDLPRLPGRRRWHDMVVQWWEQVRSMPHCVLWQPTDWQFAVETAFMKQQFWVDYSAGEMKGTTATEIRRREDQLGTTGEARRKLRIRYVFPGDDAPAVDLVDAEVVVVEQEVAGSGGASVTPLADRRRRLTQSA